MKRAKFYTLQDQRKYFIDVKDKLRVGARKLSQMLGLKSRGTIESYTFMRTAPSVEIVKKLEKLSGIKAKYQIIDGKVVRRKRGFVPLDPKDAEEQLRNKFGKDFNYLDKMIRSELPIVEILNHIRKRGYSFNNSIISRFVGAYRTNLLLKITKNMTPKNKEIVVKGYVKEGHNSLVILFHLLPLNKIIFKKKIKVCLEISEDRKKIRIMPLNYGRILSKNGGSIGILVTAKSGLKKGSHVQIILNPEDFGFTITDSIYDHDAKSLVKYAVKEYFTLDNYRSTPKDHKGDLSLFKNKKNIIIEITRALSYKSSYFKIGQLFIQKNSWPKATNILICKPKYLTQGTRIALKKLNVKVIHSNFEENWEQKVIKKIKQITK